MAYNKNSPAGSCIMKKLSDIASSLSCYMHHVYFEYVNNSKWNTVQQLPAFVVYSYRFNSVLLGRLRW